MRTFVIRSLCLSLAFSSLLVACASPTGKTKAEKREFVTKMHDSVIRKFDSTLPGIKDDRKKAKGYAVFSNTSVTVLFAGGGGGYGLAVENKGDKRTFMRCSSANLGLGLGAKDYNMLVLFNTETAFQKFLMGTWKFGGSAEASAKDGIKGGSANAGTSFHKDVVVYSMTSKGAIAKATVEGGKFSKDTDLN